MNLISHSSAVMHSFIWWWTWKVSHSRIHNPYVSTCNVRHFFGCLFTFVGDFFPQFNFYFVYALHPFRSHWSNKIRADSSHHFITFFYISVPKKHTCLITHIGFFSLLSCRLICSNSIRFTQFGVFSFIVECANDETLHLILSGCNCNHLYLY